MTNFLLTGGGTAGHVNPLLTIAKALSEKSSSNQVFVLGTSSGLEARLVPEAGFPLLTIAKLPFPRKLSFAAIAFPFRFLASVGKIKTYLKDHKIDIVVGFGGYASAPAYRAAKQLKLPIVIHEANAFFVTRAKSNTKFIASRYNRQNFDD